MVQDGRLDDGGAGAVGRGGDKDAVSDQLTVFVNHYSSHLDVTRGRLSSPFKNALLNGQVQIVPAQIKMAKNDGGFG